MTQKSTVKSEHLEKVDSQMVKASKQDPRHSSTAALVQVERFCVRQLGEHQEQIELFIEHIPTCNR